MTIQEGLLISQPVWKPIEYSMQLSQAKCKNGKPPVQIQRSSEVGVKKSNRVIVIELLLWKKTHQSHIIIQSRLLL